MSDQKLTHSISADGVEVRFPEKRKGFLSGLFAASPRHQPSFAQLGEEERDLLFAIADLRRWQDEHETEVDIGDDRILLSHDAAASLSAKAAAALGLPDDVHLTLRTDVTGVLGRPDFRLHYEWSHNGTREAPKRNGAFLATSSGLRRLPLWMKRALDLADGFDATRPLEEHWSTLAAFRQMLEPEDTISTSLPDNHEMAGLSMTAFLRGLEIHIANRFSISPDRSLGQFEVVPYSSRKLDADGLSDNEISEHDAELSGEELAVFQHRFRARGACPAYQLGNNSYLVIDPSSAPVLEEMARVQKADRQERKAFVENPRAFIGEAVNRHLEREGAFEGLDLAGQEELVEAIAGPALIESREYSERVTGVIVYTKPAVEFDTSGTAWLPEVFPEHIAQAIKDMSVGELQDVRQRMQSALETSSDSSVSLGGEAVRVTPARLEAVSGELKRRAAEEADAEEEPDQAEEAAKSGPLILDTLRNDDELSWHAQFRRRTPAIPVALPEAIRTPLREHQLESFRWATDAWVSGLPGILNADEQGLGKTLQTIAFLNWLQSHMKSENAAVRGPILVVAPTSLLRNWEEEVERHVSPRKFGNLVRLYGSSLSGHKRPGAQGTETGHGRPLLDLDWLEEAFDDGRAHRYWVLTTYTTLANYQHSLGKIPFTAIVMDEIQNIKNKDTIASRAAEAMNADFRIGLTGTPIENSTMDLWTIMDRIAPGALGSGAEFRRRYGEPAEDNMAQLHAQVFRACSGHPPLGLRRLKQDVARDLPAKTRLLHPRMMPDIQSRTYDEAQAKLAEGGPGAALKMLHHIRSVSVHPGASDVTEPDTFVSMSARLSATLDILGGVSERGERALVFIEHREMQFRFAELVRYYFGLGHVDIINGETPIPKRQAIVNRFQRHLEHDGGFDLLILGPKAAGTGLTLTAATNVIHLSRWWNPAVEEQCNDRVHRIGQSRPIEVHVPMAVHPEYGASSFDCLLHSLMHRKRQLASQALWPMGDTKGDLSTLQAGLGQEKVPARPMSIAECIAELFQRDQLPPPAPDPRGAYRMP